MEPGHQGPRLDPPDPTVDPPVAMAAESLCRLAVVTGSRDSTRPWRTDRPARRVSHPEHVDRADEPLCFEHRFAAATTRLELVISPLLFLPPSPSNSRSTRCGAR